MDDLCYQTASELARAIRDREVSSSEVVEAFLGRISAHNPALNAVVTVDEAGARGRARQADEALAKGILWGPLHGVPVTFKDVFETTGLRTTAGHEPLSNHVPARDATVVARLRGAGAIVMGKTNLPALGMDTQCENHVFGRTVNPWDPERTPGGSSGGEAAAAAAGLTPMGLGSDVGGSVRIPSHYCGLFSLMPTEGRIPRSGHIPPLPGTLNWIRHLVAVGPMARSVADLRVCLRSLAGPDGRDPSVSPVPLRDAPARPLRDRRFAWTDDFGGLPVTAATRAALRGLADELSNSGCKVERASPAGFDFERVWTTYGELVGVMMAAHFPVLPRALLGAFGRLIFRQDLITGAGTRKAMTSMRGYFEVLAQRDRLTEALESFLSEYDAWLCPVASTPAPPHRAMGKLNTPLDVDGRAVPGHLGAIGYTCPFNLTGSPVVVVPLGVSEGGLPIGVQVVGRRWDEMALLDTAEALATLAGAGSFQRPPGY